jgi:hypothetical protein
VNRLVRNATLLASAVAIVAGGWPATGSAAPNGSNRRLAPAELATPDPGDVGPDTVDTLSYDLGDTAFRPDGFPGPVELKGQVYAPQTILGRAPFVILLHGRHVTCDADGMDQLVWPCPAGVDEIPSYLGYAKLATNLASHGMVVVSIGANGINAADGYVDDGGADARAQLVLEHLRRWKAWDADATGSPFGSRFVSHIDLADVGLMGHSRGGEGVVSAAQLNQRIGSPFGIKAVLALAPTDFDRRVLGGVALETILPYCDGDVADLQGAAYYDDSRFASAGDPAPKATTLLYGANHNFFNTVWTSGPGSSDDAGGPIFQEGARSTRASDPVDPCQPGGTGRLAAAVQEQAGATLMAGFFRRYLDDDTDFQRFVSGLAPFPASTGAARWASTYHAPDRLDVERFATADNALLNRFGRYAEVRAVAPGYVCDAHGPDFVERAPRVTPSNPPADCPVGLGIPGTDRTGAVDVGWVRPSGVIREPLAVGGTDVTRYDGIRLRVAVPDDSRNAARNVQDMSVVLEDRDGHRASVRVGDKTNALFPVRPGLVQHVLLNGARVPLDAFVGVDLTHVAAVELRFDRVIAGHLQLADLAFTDEGTGSSVGPTSGSPAVPTVRPICRRTESARWACTITQLLWARDPFDDELASLRAGYSTAAGRAAAIAKVVAASDATELHARRFVQRVTQQEVNGGQASGFLTATGRKVWETAMVELTTQFAWGGPHLQTPRQIVDSIYGALVGHPADPAGAAFWAPRVEQGKAAALTASLVKTAAYAGRVVDDRYQQILGRAPDSSGRAYWIAKVRTAGGEQALVRSLLATATFRAYAAN